MTASLEHILSIAVACHQAGQLDQAEAGYRQLLRHEPTHAEAAWRLGVVLRQRGQHVAAARELARAARLHPKHVAILYEIASLLRTLKQHDRALDYYKRVIALDPTHLQALIHGGDCWFALSRAERACAWYERALTIDPQSISARNNLGSALQARGRLDEAIVAYRQVLASTPEAFETRVNLAAALHELGDTSAAFAEAQAAIERQPANATAHTNLGVMHEDQGQFDQALAAYDRALALKPDYADAHLHRALLLVQRERFAEGWDEYEWRFATRAKQRPRAFSCAAWDGSSLTGRNILIHAEQGIGDEIMFATCVPDVIAQAHKVSLTCDRRLEKLVRRSFPSANVVGVERGKENWAMLAADVNFHSPAGSLPRFLRRHEGSFPRLASLLAADPIRRQYWQARLQSLGAGLKVGISWRGGADSRVLDGSGQGAGYRAQARRRSCDLVEWNELLAVPGVQFVNLQHKATEEDRQRILSENLVRFHSFDDVDLRSDFDELAALIASLDLVISVGNATVHLAGGVGTPTWALLPRYWGWRWLSDRSDCLWYPRVRLWRQHESGNWQELLARVTGALSALATQQGLARPRYLVTPTDRAAPCSPQSL